MKKAICFLVITLTLAGISYGQRGATYTGTAVIYGSGRNTRTITRTFTLILNGRSSAQDISRYMNVLERSGQDALLREIDDTELGRISLGGSVGVPVNVVIVDRNSDETRIRVVFRRWIGFGELRAGFRSVDYPFGYMDLRVSRSGRGDGTFIPAARIRFRNADTIEVEDFGTFPGRLMGVRLHSGRLP